MALTTSKMSTTLSILQNSIAFTRAQNMHDRLTVLLCDTQSLILTVNEDYTMSLYIMHTKIILYMCYVCSTERGICKV